MAVETNRDFATEVLDRMAEGESLREVCADLKDQGCPSASYYVKLALKDSDFYQRYACAREMQCEAWADKIYHEATRNRIGEKTKVCADGSEEVTTGDNVDRSRLVVDALKWTLAKLHPKRYGDKQALEVTGKDGAPLYTWGGPPPAV